MQINRIRKLAGLPLTERYESSADFDADVDAIQEHLDACMKIMRSANWQRHIKDTQQNFDVDAVGYEAKLHEALRAADSCLKDFYEEMQEAA